MRFGMEPAPNEVLSVPASQRGRFAVERVPLPTDAVVFYRVGFALGDAPSVSEPQGTD